jgi:hypothetical protein
MDGLLEEVVLALDADLFGFLAVAKARAFVNADAPDRAAEVPVRGAVSLDELEGHGSFSRSARTSSGVKMYVRPSFRPT